MLGLWKPELFSVLQESCRHTVLRDKMCFPVNFAKFLRTVVLQDVFGQMLFSFFFYFTEKNCVQSDQEYIFAAFSVSTLLLSNNPYYNYGSYILFWEIGVWNH